MPSGFWLRVYVLWLMVFGLGQCNNCENDNDEIMNDVPNNMNIIEYIIIWLIYMLNLKDGNPISNLYDFYYKYINQRGGHSLVSTNGKDYSNIINNLIFNNNYLVDMNKNIISKFYNLLKSLCRCIMILIRIRQIAPNIIKKLKHLLMNIVNFLIIMILIMMTVHIEHYSI
ncbi:hypothetical protein YYE_01330 [Plasmodium vinckei vinckei]|nr:hypothetical protein YYE_01330 [Plasmodium vinckei vinckei]